MQLGLSSRGVRTAGIGVGQQPKQVTGAITMWSLLDVRLYLIFRASLASDLLDFDATATQLMVA